MADTVDTSPATEAQADVAGPEQAAAAESPGDGYGSATAAAGTEILRVCPPKLGRYTRVVSAQYDCGSTSHVLTLMVTLDRVQVSTDAEAGQAVIKFNKAPVDSSGNKIAANDYFVVKDEMGIFGVYRVNAVSGLSITIDASIGTAGASGFTNKVLAGRNVWFVGAAADHAARQFTMKASTVNQLPHVPTGYATSPAAFEPIVVHSNNATNAGILSFVTYSNPAVK